MFGKAACVFGRDETVPKSLHQGEHDCCIVRNEVLVFPVCIEKKHRKSRPEHRSSAFWEKLKIFLPPLVIARKAVGSSCLRSLGVQASTPTSSSQSGGRCVLLPRGLVFGRSSIDEGGIFLIFLIHSAALCSASSNCPMVIDWLTWFLA
jgi:hypothetical protein